VPLHWRVSTGTIADPGTRGLSRQRPVTTSITGPPDWVTNHRSGADVGVGLRHETAKTSPVTSLVRQSPVARSRMVLVAFERSNTHCCDRAPPHAAVRTFRTALSGLSRQNVVPRFWNAETVHGWVITLASDVAGCGHAPGLDGAAAGSGGHGGGHGGGQIGMAALVAGAAGSGQTMAPDDCGVSRGGQGGGQGGGQVGTGPVTGGVAVSGQGMTWVAAAPVVRGAALAATGSAIAKVSDPSIARTARIPRVVSVLLVMS
jgi:hypothetical protein